MQRFTFVYLYSNLGRHGRHGRVNFGGTGTLFKGYKFCSTIRGFCGLLARTRVAIGTVEVVDDGLVVVSRVFCYNASICYVYHVIGGGRTRVFVGSFFLVLVGRTR